MNPAPRPRRFGGALAALGLCLCAAPAAFAQNPPETVGRIEGEDVSVRGRVTLLREDDRSATLLLSGAEVTVRSGTARLRLEGGGEIGVCGPAQFSVLKSGADLTLALSTGRVHARLENNVAFTLYTPLVVSTPLAVGSGSREAVLGLAENGAVCAWAARGAVRIEQQLTGASLVVPERGEVELPDGQVESLRDAPGLCRCEAIVARAERPVPRPPEVSVPAASPAKSPSEEEKKEAPKTPASEQPTWKVLMPPLEFDAASAAPPPEPSPEMILLVREVRVQPALVFTGRVEPRVVPASTRVVRQEPPATQAQAAVPKEKEGFGAKLRGFFRRLFIGRPREAPPPAEKKPDSRAT
jgi:hypothetical protein